MDSHTWNPAAALTDDGFLERAARGLLGDPAAADDVAQETRFAAWRSGLSGGDGMRGWLRTVARRLAGRSRVAAARRDRREREAARPEALPSAAAIAEREELRRRVVDAVLALDASSRDVVLLRWYEDLTPREAAERLGVPVETFRTRLKRAHTRLRERLDERHGGDRAAWAAPLALCGGGRWSLGAIGGGASGGAGGAAGAVGSGGGAWWTGVGVVTMKSKWTAAAIVAVLCGAWWTLRSDELEPIAPGGGSASAPGAASESPPPEEPATLRGGAVTGVPFREPSPANAEAPAEAPTGTLEVRFVWEADRTPAVGVGAYLHDAARPGPVLARGAAARFSDAEGRLPRLRLRPGRYGVYSDRDASGWFEVVAGRTTPAEIVLPRGVEVAVEAVDAAGAAIPDADVWLSLGGVGSEGVTTGRTGADGRCVVRHAPTYALLTVRKRGFAPVVARQVMAAAGGRDEFRFVLERGGGALAGVVVDGAERPVAGAIVRVGAFAIETIETAEGATTAAPPATYVVTDDRGAFRCDALPAGRAPVRVLALDRPAWDGETEIPAGGEARLRVVMARGARVAGVVRDADGALAARQHVQIGANGDPGDVAAIETYTDADGRFACEGVAPGRTRLRAGGGRAGAASQELELVEGEEKTLEIRLAHATRIHGFAFAADGTPAKGLMLKARRKSPEGYERHLFELALGASHDGAFCFHVEGAEPVTLILHSGDDQPLDRVENVVPGGPPVTLRVSEDAKPSARFRGRVLDAQGAPIGRASVTFLDPERGGGPVVRPDPDTGRFASPPLVAGTYVIRIEADGRPALELGERALARQETLDLGDLVFEAPARLSVVVTDASGEPLVGASATVVAPGGARIWTVRREGALRAELQPGRYAVVVDPGDRVHAYVVREFEAKAGAPIALAVSCAKGVLHLIEAAGADGTALTAKTSGASDGEGRRPAAAEATIAVETSDGVRLANYLTLGAPISLVLAPGRYRATASTPDGRRGTATIDVSAPEVVGAPAKTVLRLR